MTETAATIVTALGEGPSSPLELSQRLDGIGYANIRQTLRRLAKAGIVTNPSRGVYGIDCDTSGLGSSLEHGTEEASELAAGRNAGEDRERDLAQALANVWAEFESLDDPHNPMAWA